MQAQDFLDRVLPDSGMRVVVAFSGKKPKQTYYSDNGAAAAALTGADARGWDAYHGCATYKDKSSRKAHNVSHVKSLWMDLDVGEDKPYATQADALRALVVFNKAVGLPPPLVVNSGRGIHVYWLLENEVDGVTWQRAATHLKLAAKHGGLHADPARTADVASILRTPGTHNHKNPASPLSVQLIRDGKPAPYDFILARLEQYLAAFGVGQFDLGAAPAHVSTNNSDLEVKYDGPPPSIEPIVNACAVIAEFRDSGGNIEEPLWRACMGVVRHCAEGVALCHEWSSGYEGYTYEETQAKLDGLEGTGPTTCETLEAYRPDACASCPLKGTCKSPISAAYKALPVEEIVDPEDPEKTVEVPDLPDYYDWTTKGLIAQVWNATSQQREPVKMSSMLFYMTGWTQDVDRNYSVSITAHLRKDEVIHFTIPSALVAEGGTKLLAELGKKMIHIECKPDIARKYLQAWADIHRNAAKAQMAYDRFGWYGKDFLIGNTMIENGALRNVVVSASVSGTADTLTPKGDRDTWVDLIDRAYNHVGLEPLQFALLAGLGSPLLAMFKQYGSVMLYLHTQKSGIGKTTTSRAALSCYGSWEKAQLTYTQFTQNALYATFENYNAMPVVIDEMTTITPEHATSLVHLASSGTSKRRCDKTGNLIGSDNRWSLISIASGNNLLTEKIMQDRSQAGAEFARVFECSIHDKLVPLPREEAARLFAQLADNYGWAGREFMQYVTANYDTVKDSLLKTFAACEKKFAISQSERFWAALIACVLTAHKIAFKLGLVNFELRAMIDFIQTAVSDNRAALAGATPPADVQLGRMLGDLWPGMFVTQGTGDVHNKWDAYVAKHSQGRVTGRYIMRRPGAAGVNDKPVIYITKAAAKEWCDSRKVSYRDLVRDAAAAGLVRASTKTVHLGQGSVQYSGLSIHECLVVRDSALPATMSPGAPQLTVVQGGLSTQGTP